MRADAAVDDAEIAVEVLVDLHRRGGRAAPLVLVIGQQLEALATEDDSVVGSHNART
jgi:hypothetical protein